MDKDLEDVRATSLARLVGELTPLVFCDETDQLRHVIEENFEPTRERALMLTKLDELELWATRAKVKDV